jgi:two-component system response regulator ChvI
METVGAPLIYCVDDEENIRTAVRFSLEKAGYTVESFSNGTEAWEKIQKKMPDLAVIDIIMPRMDGLELCRKIRQVSETVPVVFLTSKDDEIDRVLGLELGADDYLTKPFSMRELLARIKVIFRRIEAFSRCKEGPYFADADTSITAGRLTMDTDRFTVSWDARPIQLSVTEFRILAALAEEPGRVKNREQLLQAAYPEDLYVSDRSADSHIKRIRKKIQAVDPGFSCIEAVYGAGYKYSLTAG